MDLDANVFSEKVQIDLQKQIPMNKCVRWEKFQIACAGQNNNQKVLVL